MRPMHGASRCPSTSGSTADCAPCSAPPECAVATRAGAAAPPRMGRACPTAPAAIRTASAMFWDDSPSRSAGGRRSRAPNWWPTGPNWSARTPLRLDGVGAAASDDAVDDHDSHRRALPGGRDRVHPVSGAGRPLLETWPQSNPRARSTRYLRLGRQIWSQGARKGPRSPFRPSPIPPLG